MVLSNLGGNNILHSCKTSFQYYFSNAHLLVSGAKTVRRPMFQRLLSVPVKTQSKSKIPRSFSHPGALNNLPKFDKLKETLNFKSGFKGPGAKKHTKKGYSKFLF